ncbi:MAG: helix-turn-helix domain-containing protein [Bdellovibrio sp.]
MEKVPKLSAGTYKPLFVEVDKVVVDSIRAALIMHNYHMEKSSKALGISRITLYRKMKKYGIVKRKKSER